MSRGRPIVIGLVALAVIAGTSACAGEPGARGTAGARPPSQTVRQVRRHVGRRRVIAAPDHTSQHRSQHHHQRHYPQHHRPRNSRHHNAVPATPWHHRGKPVHVAGVPRSDLPRPGLTPGAILTVSTRRVCVPGYATGVRDVPSAELDSVYRRYGVAHIPYQHEVDHLVSLELGGSNSIRNLWPEPYAGRWGARTKDGLENTLHELVCSGRLRLRYAQRIESTDWVAAYRRYLGVPPAARPSAAPSPVTPQRQPAKSEGSCEPGYSPCLPRVADLNCSDIPAAKKPIHVSGDDPYHLDADGDGLGCE
jgi:hypothetical protein